MSTGLKANGSQGSDAFEDRRESPRFEISLFAPDPVTDLYHEHIGNISIGGVCFPTDQVYAPGQQVSILFRLPRTTAWIMTLCEIAGQFELNGKTHIRALFLDLDFEDERMLARWLDQKTWLAINQAA